MLMFELTSRWMWISQSTLKSQFESDVDVEGAVEAIKILRLRSIQHKENWIPTQHFANNADAHQNHALKPKSDIR